MAIHRETRQSLVLSILIHGGFIVFAVLFLFMERWLERPEPAVFELVSPAAAAPAIQDQPTEQADDTPIEELEIPESEPIKEVPDIPDLPEPVVEPPPPEPKPEPKPEPPPIKRMSINDFRKEHKVPDRVQQVQPKKRKPVTAPKIETDVRQRLEQQIAETRIIGAEIGQVDSTDELMRYLAELRRRAHNYFRPSGSNLKAEVHFKVTSTGSILSPRIASSSGVPAFDQSVLRAMQLVRSPGPPPGGREYEFSFVFRSE